MPKMVAKLESEIMTECRFCDVDMELKGRWISQTGMAIELYQCPCCKDVEIRMHEESEEEKSRFLP